MTPAEFEGLAREEQVRRLVYLGVEADLRERAEKRAVEKAKREGEKGQR